MNSIGTLLRLTTFGESHGPAMGGILDGMPPFVGIDQDEIREDLARRAPGHQRGTSMRKEPDEFELLSGISPEGFTLGSPIGFIVRNKDAHSSDYKGYTRRFRPNHADFTYYTKYGIHDFRGGGRSSARDTVSWVLAGSICRQWLRQYGIEVAAHYVETISLEKLEGTGDSAGGIVEGEILGLPVGIGEPVFDKLHARLAMAMMSINAVKGFEYGDGFASATMTGSESADKMYVDKEGKVRFKSNHSGGIQGGISNGMPVRFRVAFKPTPTIMQPMETIDTEMCSVKIDPAGRHDTCVAIRGAAVVEAMALLTIGDMVRMYNGKYE